MSETGRCYRISLPERNARNDNETEYDVYVLPTPMPTVATSEVTVSSTVASAVASKPDEAKLVKAMVAAIAAGGGSVSAEDISTVVQYGVKQSFSFPEGVEVTEEVAKDAFANTFEVAPEAVTVTITAAGA